jgi:hypothetical protein
MTVKEVFDLRRQGRVEEAYEAIRPMYAAHKGRYTTLCMFWTASDVFKLRMDKGRTDEAEKIFLALQRMLPRVQEIERQLQEERGTKAENGDTDSARAFMDYASHRLKGDECAPRFDRCEALSGTPNLSRGSGSTDENPKDTTAPSGASVFSRGRQPTDTEPDHTSEPRRGDTPSVETEPETEISILQTARQALSTDEKELNIAKNSHFSIPEDSPLVLLPADEKDEGNAPQQVVDVHSVSGLTPMQRIVLGLVAANPGSDLSSIAHGLGLPPQMVEPYLAALTSRGLITLIPTNTSSGYLVKST